MCINLGFPTLDASTVPIAIEIFVILLANQRVYKLWWMFVCSVKKLALDTKLSKANRVTVESLQLSLVISAPPGLQLYEVRQQRRHVVRLVQVGGHRRAHAGHLHVLGYVAVNG